MAPKFSPGPIFPQTSLLLSSLPLSSILHLLLKSQKSKKETLIPLEMESIEDVVLPIPDDPPSPIHEPKLKRLKKSSSSAIADSIRVFDDSIVANRDSSKLVAFESKNPDDLDPLFSVPSNDPIVPSSASPIYGSRGSGGGKEFEDDLDPLFSVPAVEEGFETLYMERETEEEGGSYKNIGEIGSGIVKEKSLTKRLDFISPISGSMGAEKDMELEDDLDPLFSVPAADEGFEALDLERKREEDEGFEKSGESGSGIEKKSARKRLNLDEGSEEILKKRKKKKSKADDKLGEKPKESIRGKRSEKERMAQLEQIHAESQRLLRETRDASFKPVPLVQKPISSVLEKIRLRKLEVLKQTSIRCQSNSVSVSDCSMDAIVHKNSNPVGTQLDSRDNEGDTEVFQDDFAHDQNVGSYKSPHDPCGEIPSNNASDLELKDASPTLIRETHESTQAVQSKYGDNNQLDDLEDSSDPPLLASTLTPITDDLSSEEEDDDKENIDPHTSSAVNMDSSSEGGGLAKAFLDDEAEEEDDSDHDLMRFEDNEEDDESDADEVVNDLIATGYVEAPVDHEKRNQLHQKWVEQLDAAGTDDILQRLKNGIKQRELTCLHDERDDNDDHDDGDDFGDESADEKSYEPPVTDDARQNSRKAKQMIAQMFTEADNSYVHSDDEESEHILLRQRILKQTSEPSLISPVENENSREVLGLIKKLNIAPVTKKRGENCDFKL